MITLRDVSKDFGHGPVLNAVNLTINPQEMVCILGDSGSGKSVLMSLLTGAESPTSGTVEIDGVDIRTIPNAALRIFRRKIGVVYQDGKLLQNRTVAENIAFPLDVCGAPDDLIEERTTHIMDALHLYDLRKHLPHELSTGQRTRVAIGRAIAHQPLILVADEPTQNLDPRQAEDILQIFRRINEAGTTVVIATHHEQLAQLLGCRIIYMKGGRIDRDVAATETPSASQSRSVFAPAAPQDGEQGGTGTVKIRGEK
jgi:cell division transport system ATP-binding protein